MARLTNADSERKKTLSIVKTKEEQIEAGIKSACDEMAKMQEDMCTLPMGVLIIIHPQYGAWALGVILQTCKNGGSDLDAIFENNDINSKLVDPIPNWSCLDEYQMTDFEKNVPWEA